VAVGKTAKQVFGKIIAAKTEFPPMPAGAPAPGVDSCFPPSLRRRLRVDLGKTMIPRRNRRQAPDFPWRVRLACGLQNVVAQGFR
jgi:hypothetical protein